MVMPKHLKKKIEIIVEAALARRVIQLAESLGAKGFTVLPTLAGRGHSGDWGQADLSSALATQLIVIVAAPDLAERIAQSARALLADYAAVILVSEVEVFRDDHF